MKKRRPTRKAQIELDVGKCAARATQGRDDAGIQATRYRVCLTKSQYRTLFGPGEAPKRLGCGAFGCAYARDGERHVIKITSDKEDVIAMLEAQKKPGLEHVARVQKAYELVSAGARKDRSPVKLYALRVERVDPVPRPMAGWVWSLPGGFGTEAQRYHRNPKKYPGPSTKVVGEAKDACSMEKDPKGCRRFVDEFSAFYRKLVHRGILWEDYHPGNVGIGRDGKWKIIDLGLSTLKRKRNVPLLAEALRTRDLKLPKK